MRYFVKYLNKDAAGSLKAFMQPAGELKEKFHEKEKDMDRSDYSGLISYLATYARINEYGFIEAPYRAVDKETGRVANEITYMTADEEDNFIVGQAAVFVHGFGGLACPALWCSQETACGSARFSRFSCGGGYQT